MMLGVAALMVLVVATAAAAVTESLAKSRRLSMGLRAYPQMTQIDTDRSG
jgi:hypothetical protein